MRPLVMVEVVRDGLAESRHHASALALRDARTLQRAGVHDEPVYFRSAQKPFQALALLHSGAYEQFGLTESHLALACGSIDANEEQVALVLDLLKHIGLSEDNLRCPPAMPYNPEARRRAQQRGEGKRRVFHNCAGKHAGLLAAALAYGADPKTYLEEDNPVQRHIRRMLETIITPPAGASVPQLPAHHCGGDGCGTPVLSSTLYEIALAFSRLAKPDQYLPGEISQMLTRISAAMAKHPEFTGGCDQRIDSEIVRASGGELIAKSGAEALLCVARLSDGMAIAAKSDDGFDRGVNCSMLAWLDMLGMLKPAQYTPALREFAREPITSGDKARIVGEVRYCGPKFDAPSAPGNVNNLGFKDAK